MFTWSKKRVYLDHAGAMPVVPEAKRAFTLALRFEGNPGALHQEAQKAAEALFTARKEIAAELGCKAQEIIFTSGGTEGNNLAILGLFKRLMLMGKEAKKTHWIVSGIEHPSVLDCFAHIKDMGAEVTVLAPDPNGRIQVTALKDALRKETVCVSIGWANGEIGVVQPLGAFSETIRAYEKENGTEILFHSDLGQAPLYLSPQVHTLGVDVATLDGGKLGAPRGIGAIFLKSGKQLVALLYGGSQEAGLRPGTENVALSAGFAAALKQAAIVRGRESVRLEKLREHLIRKIESSAALTGVVINGSARHHVPHITNISIPHIDNEYITLGLDREGFALATKSACKEGERASHVILALTSEEDVWRASSALRISAGLDTREADIDSYVQTLGRLVSKYRTQT